MLSDTEKAARRDAAAGLNAPFGARCFLTGYEFVGLLDLFSES